MAAPVKHFVLKNASVVHLYTNVNGLQPLQGFGVGKRWVLGPWLLPREILVFSFTAQKIPPLLVGVARFQVGRAYSKILYNVNHNSHYIIRIHVT